MSQLAGEPVLEISLVLRPRLYRGMTRRRGQLSGGAQEAASTPFRMPRGSREVIEHGLDLRVGPAVAARIPIGKLPQTGLIAGQQIGRDQFVLAGKMIIERALRNAGLCSHGVHAYTADALRVEQLGGHINNVLPRGALRSAHQRCIPYS